MSDPSSKPTKWDEIVPKQDQALAAREGDQGQLLFQADPEEFLPSPLPWVRRAAWLLVVGFASTVGFMAVWPYRVVVRGSGQVRPSGETSVIQAPFPARVSAVLAQPNQAVQAGQVLAQLDSTDLTGEHQQLRQSRQAMLRQAEAMRAEHRASRNSAALHIDQAQAALQLAAAELRRFEQLAKSGSVAAMQLDSKQAAYKKAEINLLRARQAFSEEQALTQSAQAQLERQMADQGGELNQTVRDLDKTAIRAPVTGVLFQLNLRNPGQMVAAGEELARIAPSSVSSQVKVIIPSKVITNVEVGQHADLRVSGCPYPDYGTLSAKVVSVAPEISVNGGYEVILKPQREQLISARNKCALRIGMEVQAAITTKQETVLGFLLRKARLETGF